MIIFDYAVKMEKDGEVFYREQAAKAPNEDVAGIFNMLADEEQKHAEVLSIQDTYTEDSLKQLDKDYDYNLFEMQLAILFDENYIMTREVFTLAVEMEQKSIELYTGLLSEATEESDRHLLKFLVGQEERHLELFQRLLELE